MRNPRASIIITTKNEELVLNRLLESVSKQSYRNIEIIVVDNKSTDCTRKIASKYTKKVYIFGPERSAQRNYGAKKSRGRYLLFLDADMQLSKDVVKECLQVISKDKNIGLITIPEESIAQNYWERVKAYERSFYNSERDAMTDAARFFKKDIFRKVGGYDETITGPEDWDLPEMIKKNGYSMERINAKIFHYERIPHPFALARKKFYYALTSYRYLQKHNISPVSAKTIYFLRPIFYKNWKHLIAHPWLSLGMFAMFTLEQVGGGFGYLVGKYKKL